MGKVGASDAAAQPYDRQPSHAEQLSGGGDHAGMQTCIVNTTCEETFSVCDIISIEEF